MANRVRFYTVTAPEWWPYQLVSASNKRLPKIKPRFYRLLVDNGAFAWFKRGEKPNPAIHWRETLELVNKARLSLRPLELWVILPDFPWDPFYTLEQAKSRIARDLCEYVDACVVTAQAPRRPSDYPACDGQNAMRCYSRIAEEIAAIDWISVIAAPCKLQCSRITPRGRRIVDGKCQVAIAEQVCSVAREHGLGCHVLGAKLDPAVIAKLAELGVTSFDTASWIRPRNTVDARMAAFSAIGKKKDEYFRMVIDRLKKAGIELEGV